MAQVPIFGPDVPFAGVVTAREPSTLDHGEFQVFNNINVDSDAGVVRSGIASDRAAPPTGDFRGGLRHPKGDWVAVRISGATRVYQWDAGGAAWSEITDVATRFTNDDYVHFEIVREGVFPDCSEFSDNNASYVVMQNGSELPRIRNASLSGGYSTHIHQKLLAPDPAMSVATPVPSAYFPVSNASTTYTNSSVNFTGANATYSGAGNYIAIAATTSAAAGDSIQVTFPTTCTPLGSKQFHIVHRKLPLASSLFWSNVEVRVRIAGTWYVLHLPSSSQPRPFTAEIDDANAQTVWDVSTILTTGGSVVAGGIPSGTADKIEFIWRGSTPASAQAVQVYAVSFGGGVPYGTSAAVAYFAPGPRAESPGVVCKAGLPPFIKDCGGTPIPGLRFCKVSEATYNLQVSSSRISGLNSSATRVEVFIGNADGDYYQWAAAMTALGSGANDLVTTTVTNTIVIPREMPSALHECLPIASTATYVNDRLVVGNSRQSTSDTNTGEVWVSAKGYWQRFRRISEARDGSIVAASPAALTLEGHKVQRIVPISTGVAGFDDALIFTDRAVYAVNTSSAYEYATPRKLSNNGTQSPYSVAVQDSLVAYLDAAREVRVIGASSVSDTLSRRTIATDLRGIPAARVPYVAGVWHKDKYYLAITPSGGTINTTIWIYDLRKNGWLSHTTANASIGFERLFVEEQSGIRKLFSFLPSGAVVEHENAAATSDLGTAINALIRTREFTNANSFDPVYIRRTGVVIQKWTNGSIVVTRHPFNGSTVSSAINVGSSTLSNSAWRWDGETASDSIPKSNAKDWAVAVDFSMAAPSGTKLYSIVADIEVGGPGADSN